MPNEGQLWQRWKGIMKCYPFEEKRLAKWQPPYLVQPKYDGIRCRAVHTDNGYILLSSEENLIFSVPHINAALNKVGGLNYELDGELYCHGKTFEEIVSITSRTTNIHPDAGCIVYHIFDVVIEDMIQMRRQLLVNQLGRAFDSPSLTISPYAICDSLDAITRYYDELISKGYEGIIVRDLNNLYVRRRSTQVMKFKPKKEDSYVIVGFAEEIDKEGMGKGSLGSLTCQSGDGNLFNVGTGFSADQRQVFWDLRDRLVGRTAKIKYQHITSGMNVPRFPVFVEIEEGLL